MALIHERLLHGDAALHQYIANLTRIVKTRGFPYLTRNVCQIL